MAEITTCGICKQPVDLDEIINHAYDMHINPLSLEAPVTQGTEYLGPNERVASSNLAGSAYECK